MKIRIHKHTTYHNCDDCGLSSSEIYSLSGGCGSFKHGDPAYCYGNEDGDIEIVLEELFKRLREKGFDVTIPEIKDNDIDSVLNHEKFIYSNGYVHYLRNFGIDIKLTYSAEDLPDSDNSMEIEEL